MRISSFCPGAWIISVTAEGYFSVFLDIFQADQMCWGKRPHWWEGYWDLVCPYPFFSRYLSSNCFFFCFLKSALLLLFPDLVILHIFISSSEMQWEVALPLIFIFLWKSYFSFWGGGMFPILTNWMRLCNFDLIPPQIVPAGACAGNFKMGATTCCQRSDRSQWRLRMWMHRPMSPALKSHDEGYKQNRRII